MWGKSSSLAHVTSDPALTAITCGSNFKVSGDGHRALEQWALSLGSVATWGVEGAGGIGRHTAAFLCMRGHDVRDVCPNRTNERARRRREGKSDVLDSERIARETLAHPELPRAFKRAGSDTGPDETGELLSLRHKERRSVVKLRQQLLSEAESLLSDLPDIVRDQLPASKKVRTRLTAIGRRDRTRVHDPATELRLRLLDDHAEAISQLDAREREATRALEGLIEATESTLGDLYGLSTRSVAELLVEIGDARRFTEGGFARFNGTAGTGGSTRCCTAWRSRSFAATRVPRRSTRTRVLAGRPKRKRGGLSSATSATSCIVG